MDKTEKIILEFLDQYRISSDAGIESGDNAPYIASAWRILSNAGFDVKNMALQLSRALNSEEIEKQDWIHT